MIAQAKEDSDSPFRSMAADEVFVQAETGSLTRMTACREGSGGPWNFYNRKLAHDRSGQLVNDKRFCKCDAQKLFLV